MTFIKERISDCYEAWAVFKSWVNSKRWGDLDMSDAIEEDETYLLILDIDYLGDEKV